MIVPARPATWRLPVLFVRTRSLLQTVLAIAAVASLLLMLEGRVAKDAIDPLLVVQIVPALLASAVGVGMWTPIGELERTAARSMPRYRGTFALLLVALAIGAAVVAVQGWTGTDVERVVMRNVIGLSGLALLATRFIDARLSWIAPLAWMCVAIIAGWIARPETGIAAWVWSARDAGAMSSWLIAGGLLIAGVTVVAVRGPRDVLADTL